MATTVAETPHRRDPAAIPVDPFRELEERLAASHGPANVFGFKAIMRRLIRKRSALFGLVIIVILVFVAAFAPMLAPHDRNLIYKTANLIPPVGWTKGTGSKAKWDPATPAFSITETDVKNAIGISKETKYPRAAPDGRFYFALGTDKNGRDMMSRLIYGARVSLIVGVVAELINLIIGVTIGAAAGFYGGRLDNFLMRVTDIFFAFPSLLLAIALLAAMERPGLFGIFVALGVTGWTPIARIVRGQVL
ncbi:MAG TPA: ABC transporter permease, partial [bacterium]|nr:ABC transporter permease [bacterium]